MFSNQLKQVQIKLAAGGYNPGPTDGLWGPKTRAALQAWQRKNNRPQTDYMPVQDIAAILGSTPSFKSDMQWIVQAQRLLGLKEGVGKLDNPIIIDWGVDLDVNYPNDSVAWCGLFTGHTMSVALPNEPLPANILGARQWDKFGQNVTPQLGAVGVFWRGSPTGWQGHVGYLMGDSGSSYIVLGGNQSDSVSYTSIAKSRLISARWPTTAGPVPSIALPSKPPLMLSTNEA